MNNTKKKKDNNLIIIDDLMSEFSLYHKDILHLVSR